MEMPEQDRKTARAADAIVAAVEARIASGGLKDGAPLPAERALMEEFGASRTVVREAITALSNRGLIDARPRFRPVVRRIGYQSVIDATSPVIRRLLSEKDGVRNLYKTRVFVERLLVRDAALDADREDIRRLKEALARNADAIEDSDAFYATDVSFHRVLYEISGNPVFTAIHEGFVAWLSPQWARMERSPERNRRNHAAHEQIYTAILERDPDRAEAALEHHLAAAWDFVSTTFFPEDPD
ncbi:MAG: FCD domain-containing protein [Paracoccus sp. (in: a-proteobacteria)]|jgi:DNA-binding FadR family transcriptional regulator|uniref:FCD domain-containing protein n=2 Tax=Paracoccus sp. TaxID=267 RepID=UPI00183759D0|nr:FCD domain-containing protein [uncultured Paracoccus sp.]HIC66203.1 FCD domain-containing protein [Paracoccus sp. (in: a-proteobacteria)]|tara:strand:- start:4076 stop:4801 length:726 start_codon:yes stop_codon:yes gene_type:complete